ncbi:MAG: adenosylcobinamide-GDP ribazoletransferase [Dongiaceae bacterium]
MTTDNGNDDRRTRPESGWPAPDDNPPAAANHSDSGGWFSPTGWFGDLGFMLSHLTRLPAPSHGHVDFRSRLAFAVRANPLVGLIVGAIGGVAYGLASWLGLGPLPAATLAVLATLFATGAYHEDGLADTADGMGGAFERERKLAIMSDSRHGSYGVVAIVATMLLRIGAIAALADPGLVFAALIATHAVARGLLPAIMFWRKPAKADGQGFQAGTPESGAVVASLVLAVFIAIVALGFDAFVPLLAAAVGAWAMTEIARRQIGGYTGDVLGASEQIAEIAMLLALAAALG